MNGNASATLTANQTAGQFEMDVTAGSLITQFFPTSTTNVPAHITIVDGNNQSQPINTQNGSLIDLAVTDASNNPVPGVPITLTVPSTGASINLSGTTIVTAVFAQGFVSVGEARLDPIGVANGTAGSYVVTGNGRTCIGPDQFHQYPGHQHRDSVGQFREVGNRPT